MSMQTPNKEGETSSPQPPSIRFPEYLQDRFGILLPPSAVLVGDNSLRIMNNELSGFKTTTPKGIPASRMKGKFPKPTTAFIQIFGSLATKNTLPIEKEDALAYLYGEDFAAPDKGNSTALKGQEPATESRGLERGYVILKYKNAILGLGFYKEGKMENLFPKGRRIQNGKGSRPKPREE